MPTEPHEVELSPQGLLLQQCLDTPPAERPAAVARLCAEQPALAPRLRRLLSLLTDYHLVDEPVREPAGMPERVGPYRILGLLGSGGMGVVYLAQHEGLGRKVALKVLHHGLASTERARARFRREALAAARIEHPGICPVYDVGEDGDDPFLAMRYVQGRSLQQVLAASRAAGHAAAALPRQPGEGEQAAILRFVEQAAMALHCAHEAGLVHRDVKPGNLLVTESGDPMLVDFGLALDDRDADALTLTGDQLGTPSYMAPEQVRTGAVDRRTDVHALGVVLYECLTLRLPFDAPNRHDLQSQILHDEAPDPRQHHRGIGRDLWTVLQTTLAKEPERRYRSASAFAEDLARVRRHEPILARRDGPWRRLQRFVRRNPVAAAFVGFLLVAVGAFAVLLRERDLALAETADALRTSSANERALQARAFGQTSAVRSLASAREAVERRVTAETASALYEAFVQCRERVLMRHGTSVWNAVFSADGRQVLSCSDDHTARLWSRTGESLAVMRHDGAVYDARFLPDGRIATASADGTARLWSSNGEPLHVLDHRTPAAPGTTGGADTPSVQALALRPQGDLLATSDDKGTVRVWSLTDGRPAMAPLQSEHGLLSLVEWSTDGSLLVTAESRDLFRPQLDATFAVVVHELRDGRLQPRWRTTHHQPLRGAALSPDGDLIALSSDSAPQTTIWDFRRGTKRELPQNSAGAAASWGPDGQRLLTNGAEGLVRVWSRDGALLASADVGAITYANFLADGRIVAYAWDYAIHVFDQDLHLQWTLRGHDELVSGTPVLSSDGTSLVSASWDGTVRIWDLFDAEMPRLCGHRGGVRGVAFAADGSLVSIADDGTMRLWNVRDGTSAERTIALYARSICLADDGRSVLVAHADSTARCYALPSGAPLAVHQHRGDYDIGALFLGDGRVLVGGRGPTVDAYRGDGTATPFARCWDRMHILTRSRARGLLALSGWDPSISLCSEDGTQQASWPAHAKWTSAMAFSPDGTLLASGSHDHTVRLWDVRDPAAPRLLTAPLTGHDAQIRAIAWSPRGDLLASAGSEGAVHLWHTGTWTPFAVLRGHRGGVNAIAFDSDGEHLWSGGDDGVVQAWPTTLAELLRLADARLAVVSDGGAEAFTTTPQQLMFLVAHGEPPAALALAERVLDRCQPWQLNAIAFRIVDPSRTHPHRATLLPLAQRAATAAVERTGSRNPVFLATLARVLWTRGDREAARERQAQAVQLAPGRKNLRESLAEYEQKR